MSRKIKTTDGVTLVEVIDSLDERKGTENRKSSRQTDLNDHEPMRITALATTVGAVGVGTTTLIAGYDPLVAAGIGFFGVILTAMAKGKHESGFCVALMLSGIAFTMIPLILKFKAMGLFDWLTYSM